MDYVQVVEVLELLQRYKQPLINFSTLSTKRCATTLVQHGRANASEPKGVRTPFHTIQIPCYTDARCIASNYSVVRLIFRIIRPTLTLHTSPVHSRNDFPRFQPLSRSARSSAIQLIALSVELHHSGHRNACTIRTTSIIVARTLLVQIRNNSRATTNSIVRYSIQRRMNRKVEHNDLLPIAWTLRAYAIASAFLGEIQSAFGTWIVDATGRVHHELAVATRTTRVHPVALAIVPRHIALLALAHRMRRCATRAQTRLGKNVLMTSGARANCSCGDKDNIYMLNVLFLICLPISQHWFVSSL